MVGLNVDCDNGEEMSLVRSGEVGKVVTTVTGIVEIGL
jgi:hypothetical protein